MSPPPPASVAPPPSAGDLRRVADKVDGLSQTVTRLATLIGVVGTIISIVFGVAAAIFWDVRKSDVDLLRQTHEATIRMQMLVEQNDRRLQVLERERERRNGGNP